MRRVILVASALAIGLAPLAIAEPLPIGQAKHLTGTQSTKSIKADTYQPVKWTLSVKTMSTRDKRVQKIFDKLDAQRDDD